MGELNLRYNSMERTIRRRKNNLKPKQVEGIENIAEAYEDQLTMFNHGLNLRKTERFYINTIQCESFSFTIFASMQIISMIRTHILPENRYYLLDGTFDMVPMKQLYQFLIIHIQYGKSVSIEI